MFRCTLCLTMVALVGCGSLVPDPEKYPDPKPKAQTTSIALPEGKKLMLAAEPAGVKGVIAVREEAKDGDEVVVAGQVGGSAKPFTEGRASFVMADTSLKPSAECDSPWDFCEYPKKEVIAGRLSVKFVDAEGKTLGTGARELFGLRELSHVVVRGKVRRDDKDNLIVLASAIYVRPEAK